MVIGRLTCAHTGQDCPPSAETVTGPALIGFPGVSTMDRDAQVTASQAVAVLGEGMVSLALICMWRRKGHLKPVGKRGRSPLYRWGDILAVETRMARAAVAANNPRARRWAA
jgi:hypothetical protein